LRRTLLLASALSSAAATASPPAASSASVPARLGRVDPALLEMAKRHDDFGTRRASPQELDDPGAENGRGIARQRGDAFRVEEHHARPGHSFRRAVGAAQIHDEKIALVIERVLGILVFRERFAAELLEHRQMFLAALEGLLHRDHAVPEHAGLRHG
jgi:hypothetical protein